MNLMRLHLQILTLMGLIVVSSLDASAQNNDDLRANASRLLAHAFTDSLPDVDRIDLFHITGAFEQDKKKGEVFEIAGNDVSFAVASKKTLRGKNCEKIIEAWRCLRIPQGPGGAFCHTPPYGIRLYRGDKVLLETTICWECHNFYMSTIDQETGALRLSLQRVEDKGNRLFQVLNEIIPINTDKKKTSRTKP